MRQPHDTSQHTTLVSTLISPTLLTLAHYLRHPRKQSNHVTHAGTPPTSPTTEASKILPENYSTAYLV